MSDLNTVIISGRITRDPAARGGGSVAAMSVASNRQYQRNGEWVDETTYADVTAFGHNATRCIEKLQKGDPVTIQGRLELNTFENADGEKRSQLRIIANSVQSPVFTAKLRRAYRAIQSEAGEELPTSANVSDEETTYIEDPHGTLVASNGQPVEDDDIPF